MRALITGVSGFVGRHLAAHLCSRGASVAGVRSARGRAFEGVELFIGDIRDRQFMAAVVDAVAPTHVFHLAGAIAAPVGEPMALYGTNVIGTVAVFEALRGRACTVLVASTSAVYGVGQVGPVTEDAPCRPVTAYGASKAGQEMVAIHYAHASDLPVVITRTFNLIGPGQSPFLMASSVARQIADAELGGARRVLVGDLTSTRDYLDVRDAVRAYVLLAERCSCLDVFNVCSGTAHDGHHLVDVLAGESAVPLERHVDPRRIRPHEVRDQVGDPSRLREAAGWTAAISVEQSLRDLLDWWRHALRSERSLAR